jgi:hypothetical protein
MASGSHRRVDDLEGKLSERSLKRRVRSGRRKKGPSFESMNSDKGRRRRSRRDFDDDRIARLDDLDPDNSEYDQGSDAWR